MDDKYKATVELISFMIAAKWTERYSVSESIRHGIEWLKAHYPDLSDEEREDSAYFALHALGDRFDNQS